MDAAKDKFKQTLGELALEGARDRVQVRGLASQVNRTGSMLAKNKSLGSHWPRTSPLALNFKTPEQGKTRSNSGLKHRESTRRLEPDNFP
jgi:hypothetical protein